MTELTPLVPLTGIPGRLEYFTDPDENEGTAGSLEAD